MINELSFKKIFVTSFWQHLMVSNQIEKIEDRLQQSYFLIKYFEDHL